MMKAMTPPKGIWPVLACTATVVALATYMSAKSLFTSTDVALFKNTRSDMSNSEDAVRRAKASKECIPMRWIARFSK
jgi:hypothetical protein